MTTIRELMGRITRDKARGVENIELLMPLAPELLALAAAVVDLEEKAAAYQKATTGPERNCTWSAVEMARKIKFDALSALQAKLEAIDALSALQSKLEAK
jgi:hypothetical protein